MRKNDMRYTITNKLVTNTKTNNSLGKLKITLEFHETPYQFNINHDAAMFYFLEDTEYLSQLTASCKLLTYLYFNVCS